MIRFFILFLVLQAVLFGAELTPWAQKYFVVPWTNALAAISATLVTLVDPNVAAVGKVLRSTPNGFAVSIEAGCNGVEATIVLLAAVLAFPAPWKNKLIGLAAGNRRRAGPQHRARDQPVLPRAVGPTRCSSGRTCTSGRR